MAFFGNSAVNRVNFHSGVHAVAVGAGGLFYFAYLLHAGVSVPMTLAASAGSISPADDVMGPTIGEDPVPSASEVVGVAIVPRWEMALAMVAASDAIATGPRRMAERQAGRMGLQGLDPPMPAAGWTVSMVRREGADAGLDWFCDQVRALA